MFRCRLMKPTLDELRPGEQAIVRVDVDGEGLEDRPFDGDPNDPMQRAEEALRQRRGWRQDERDKGCIVLRTMDTEQYRYVWFKAWVGETTFKVKFEKETSTQVGEAEKTKEVDSADPLERALTSVRKDVESGKANVDELAAKVLRSDGLRVTRLFEMSETSEDEPDKPAPDVVPLAPRRSALAPFSAFSSPEVGDDEESK